MSRRCPPGVLCIENVTLFMLFLIFVSILFYIFFVTRKEQTANKHVVIKENNLNKNNSLGLFPRPSFSFSNITNDILLNPYSAPLRDDRYFNENGGGGIRGIPINIQTTAVDTTYRQVGILTRNNSSEMILPLMGRPLFTSRDKWNFYTISDKNIKLPVTFKNKSCTNEYGCDNVYNGDNVYVDGLNDTFKVTMYDNNVMKYIPFL
jgi:hypothetical protein